MAVALLLEYTLKKFVHRLVGVDPFLDIHGLVNLHELVDLDFQVPGYTQPLAAVQMQELWEQTVLHDPKNMFIQVNHTKNRKKLIEYCPYLYFRATTDVCGIVGN